jgi:hypothetical protein
MQEAQSLYVLFSPSEHSADGESGFWSNMGGWGCVEDATLFSSDETSEYMKAMSREMDAEWVPHRVVMALMRSDGSCSHNREEVPAESAKPASTIDVFVCADGKSYQLATSGVRMIISGLESEDGCPCELHVRATHEGIIVDAWSSSVLDSQHLGTRAEQYQDIVLDLKN